MPPTRTEHHRWPHTVTHHKPRVRIQPSSTTICDQPLPHSTDHRLSPLSALTKPYTSTPRSTPQPLLTIYHHPPPSTGTHQNNHNFPPLTSATNTTLCPTLATTAQNRRPSPASCTTSNHQLPQHQPPSATATHLDIALSATVLCRHPQLCTDGVGGGRWRRVLVG